MQSDSSIWEQIEFTKPKPTADVISLGLFLGLMTVVTIGGNLLVILAVTLVKKLRTPSNFLIVSLAVSDLLVGVTAMPLAEFKQLVGSWPLGEELCDTYIAFDVLLCTASILNLCAISIDRYLAITRPLQYAAKRTPKRMMIMIAIVWIASALISIPPMFGFKEKFIPGMCEYSSNIIYQIYATCGAFYIPLIVMIVLYGRIFILARHMAQEDAKQKRVTDSVAHQASSSYSCRNGRPSTMMSDDLKTWGDQTELYESQVVDASENRHSRIRLRRSKSHDSRGKGALAEKYPLPPSELCRRRKPRPMHRASSENLKQQTGLLLKTEPSELQESVNSSAFRAKPNHIATNTTTAIERKSPSGLSCAEEFEERVKALRKLRAEFFAAPPSRHRSSVILNYSRDGSLSREPSVRPLSLTNNETHATREFEPASQHKSPLHHSHTMRETLMIDYNPQPRGSMPPPPKLSISYYSEDPSIVASPSQASDAVTTWTVVEPDREQTVNTKSVTRSSLQPIPRPRPRPLHGARRSVTNASDHPHKDYQSRYSLLGLPHRGFDRRSSTPLVTEPYGWHNSGSGDNRASTDAVDGARSRTQTGRPGNTDSPDRESPCLDRSTSRLFHRTSDHTLMPPTAVRSRAPSWASIRVPIRRRRGRGHVETKAIKTLGVIMGCFCLCWIPFFIVALARPMHKVVTGHDLPVPPALESLFLWLGYINSTINPIIYAIFNREFRIPFKEILLCRCRGINARLRSQRFAVEYGMAASTASGMGYPQTDPSGIPLPGSSGRRRSNNQLARNASDAGFNHIGHSTRTQANSLSLPAGYHGRRPSHSIQQ